MSNWQPIETAPKDGTRIDLWIVDQDGKGWREADAYWTTDRTAYPYTQDPKLFGKKRDGWFGPNHDYDGEDGWCDDPEGWVHKTTGKHHFERATHWMPIPDGPSD